MAACLHQNGLAKAPSHGHLQAGKLSSSHLKVDRISSYAWSPSLKTFHLHQFRFHFSPATSIHPIPLPCERKKKNGNQIMPTNKCFERSGFWAKEPLRKNLVAIFGEHSVVDLDYALDLKCGLRLVWLVGEKFFNPGIFNAWGTKWRLFVKLFYRWVQFSATNLMRLINPWFATVML